MLICAGQEAPAPASDTPAKGGCSLAPGGRGGCGGVRDAGSCVSLLVSRRGGSRRGDELLVGVGGRQEEEEEEDGAGKLPLPFT